MKAVILSVEFKPDPNKHALETEAPPKEYIGLVRLGPKLADKEVMFKTSTVFNTVELEPFPPAISNKEVPLNKHAALKYLGCDNGEVVCMVCVAEFQRSMLLTGIEFNAIPPAKIQ
jgi:hypothetical protein